MASLMDAPDVLKKIAAYKADEVAALKARTTIQTLREEAAKLAHPRGFEAAIKSATGPALICEVKKASPSKGVIREDFDPIAIAQAYETGGATCLSVLTDGPGFQGSNEIFAQVRAATHLPLLRKDFLLDPIQVAESAAMGADCILIIMGMIDDETAQTLHAEATSLGLDALIETHDERELERAITLGGSLIGINNRDLRTFHTTLETFTNLAPKAPKSCTLIAESGVFTREDILRLASEGAQGYLIGESFMRQDDVTGAVKPFSLDNHQNIRRTKDDVAILFGDFGMLTQKQRDLLILIDKRIKAVGVPPSYDEMKDALGLASKSGIHRLISALEERGFIRRLPNKARALEVLKLPEGYNAGAALTPVPANDAYEIPFVGKIAAGLPIAAIEDTHNLMAVPPSMMGNGDHYALEVEGESMIEAGIMDGDIVVIRKANTARNNEIVVALVDQDEATLKRIYRSGNQVELIAENKDFPTKTYGPDRVEVQGILVGLVRSYN